MSPFSKIKNAVFVPPYAGLPAAVFAFFLICFALHPFSPFFTHHLADPDDYMRLNEVAAWLQGQGWHDLSAPRLSPGAGTIVHWSRLIDMPIALVALPFIPLFGVVNAVFAAAMIVPLAWLAVLLFLLSALARPLVGGDRAAIASVTVLFMPMLLFNYTPGRVDHHGVQAIIAGFGLLSLTRIIVGDQGTLFAIVAAAAFACGFWIGAEALPWAILFVGCLAIAAAWQGQQVARDAMWFGVCLPVFTALLIPVALPMAQFSSRALSWFSPAYVIFAALAGAVFIIGWAAGRFVDHKAARLSLYALLGIGAVVAFFAAVPLALNGPFIDYDTFDATTALDNITEAMPMAKAFHINHFMPVTFIPAGVAFGRWLFLPLIGFMTCAVSARRSFGAVRIAWLAHGIFLLAALLLTLFWQMRVGIFMEIFAVVPVTHLLCSWCADLKWKLWDRGLFWAEVGIFMLLGPLPVILIPAAIAKTPLYPDVLLFPAARGATTCDLAPVLPFLNIRDGLGAKTSTIMNTSDSGPQILYETRHSAVAGNFDVAGNADAFAFFNASDDRQARQAAAKWGADLVLLCKNAPTLYLGRDYYAASHMRLQKGKDGLLHMVNTDRDQPLIERLVRGEVPGWLKPVEIPVPSDYLLFRIQPVAGKK